MMINRRLKDVICGCAYLACFHFEIVLTHISLASFLGDIGKQYSPTRWDAVLCGVPSGAILFA